MKFVFCLIFVSAVVLADQRASQEVHREVHHKETIGDAADRAKAGFGAIGGAAGEAAAAGKNAVGEGVQGAANWVANKTAGARDSIGETLMEAGQSIHSDRERHD